MERSAAITNQLASTERPGLLSSDAVRAVTSVSRVTWHGAIRVCAMPWRLDLFAGMLMVHGDVESLREIAIMSSYACRSRLLMPFWGGRSTSLARLAGRHDIKRTLFMARSQGEATATATALILFHGVQQRFLAVFWERVK